MALKLTIKQYCRWWGNRSRKVEFITNVKSMHKCSIVARLPHYWQYIVGRIEHPKITNNQKL